MPGTTARATRQPGTPAARESDPNRILPEDLAVHEWYRFVLSFPPHLVRDYLSRFGLQPGDRVLDPFCGTGTTVVEAKKHGFAAVGIEANPVAHLASRVKTDWCPDPDALEAHAEQVADAALALLAQEGVPDTPDEAPLPRSARRLSVEAHRLLLTDSISPKPLHKSLALLEAIDRHSDPAFTAHERLAFASAIVADASNLKFGPEVGIGKARVDAEVVAPWLAKVRRIAADLREVRRVKTPAAVVHDADAREVDRIIADDSIDAVITSPPYPNEKDYSRTTRLESVLLGFTRNMAELRAVKKRFVRSNTRSVYVQDTDHEWVAGHPEIERIASAIEARRMELGKTSGFERRYAWLTKLYFGGMARHLASLRPKLRTGARLAYVVGDQASYLQVMIRTGRILGEIAGSLGYQVESIDLFRTRVATATRDQLREEVVVLRWPGGNR